MHSKKIVYWHGHGCMCVVRTPKQRLHIYLNFTTCILKVADSNTTDPDPLPVPVPVLPGSTRYRTVPLARYRMVRPRPGSGRASAQALLVYSIYHIML